MAEVGKNSGGAPKSTDTLEVAALKVLLEGDPWLKAEYGDLAASLWLEGAIREAYDEAGPLLAVPSRPARSDMVRLVAPRDMPKLGKAGSLQSRQALVHSLVHTESWAVDLSWDIIARFGKAEAMPRAFFDDFVRVAQDEGRHFLLLAARLKELNSRYGALPAHDGLWDSAETTAHDLKARLAVEHCVHEARGLDVLPTTISRFRRGGDEETAKLLETVIYPEEITHCAAGVKWFSFLCLRDSPEHLLTHPKENSQASRMLVPKADIKAEDDDDDKLLESKLVRLDLDGAGGGLSSADSSTTNCQMQSGDGSSCRESLMNGEAGHQKVDSGVAMDGRQTPESVVSAFHSLVRNHFRGPLKPPFNDAARAAAGFGPEWYLPLATKV